MDMAKSVLVVVDAQNGFVTDHSAPVVPVLVDLVRRWESAGGSMVFTRYLNYPGSPFERYVRWSAMMTSPEIDIVPELVELSGHATAVLDKTLYTMFNEEGQALVKKHGWTDIYVSGIATESCVLKTAVDAFELGLTPWIVEDASASTAGPAAHEAGLLVAGRFIGRGQIVRTTDLALPAATPI